jgi:hypothetical protein
MNKILPFILLATLVGTVLSSPFLRHSRKAFQAPPSGGLPATLKTGMIAFYDFDDANDDHTGGYNWIVTGKQDEW